MNESHSIFLETADFLGARLCRDAIWAGRRCNWLGAATVELTGGAQTAAHCACGPDLYNGTSGIALFLARLYASTGEKIFRLTAEGAIRQALSRLDDFPPEERSGFYQGLIGIAYSLVELAEIFDTEKFAAMALLILEEVGKDDPGRHGVDVIAGSAGAIPALLKIHRQQPQDFLLEMAIRHGEHLLSAVGKSDVGWTWGAPPLAHQSVGFAYGLTGIAWALVELYRATGREAFRHAAEQAFLSERVRFGTGHNDRLDLRAASDVAAKADVTTGGSTTWSHGASGIGLVRLRAFELLSDDTYLDEAKAALQLTTETLSGSFSQTAREDFSPAHGLAGMAELLLYASRTLKDEAYKLAEERIGRLGIERYRNGHLPWPCGAPGRAETPNLMLGLAGIGYFYLRLHDAWQTPSLLMVLPETAAS